MQNRAYKVHLLKSIKDPEVFYTSEFFDSLFDANEFIHWLSCQLSTPAVYQIVEYHINAVNQYIPIPHPIAVKPATKCKYYPPYPLTLSVRKKRSKYKHENKLYYEY